MKVDKIIDNVLEMPVGEFFNWQIQTLENRGYGELVKNWNSVERLRGIVINSPSIQKNRIPFLIVFPKNIVPVEYQMPRIILGGKFTSRGGNTYMTSDSFDNMKELETPSVPYLLSDVDVGLNEKNVDIPTADERATLLAENGRTPLTIEEGISLVTHFPQVLWGVRHTLCLHGSRAHFHDQVQGLFRYHGPVCLSFVAPHMPWKGQLVPSCSKRSA